MSLPPRIRLIGKGRAAMSLARALDRAGWQIMGLLGRTDDFASAGAGTDLLVLAVPDSAIATVAEMVEPGDAVVAHMSGSLGLDVLSPHARRGGVHPLVALPNAEVGASRLVGAWFGVCGDPMMARVVSDLGGQSFEVSDEQRAAYHAAAAVASNHLVALMGQVERIAEGVGVPPQAYVQLAAGALDNVAALGPADALTGPAARGDWETLVRHLQAIDPSERPAYLALADAARRLVDGGSVPAEVKDLFNG